MEGLYKKTLTAIEVTVGVFSLAYALGLIASKVSNVVDYNSAITDSLTSTLATNVYSIVSIVAGAAILTGIATHRHILVQFGLFWSALVRIFMIVSIWIVNGFLQPSWLANGAVCIACAILWIFRKAERFKRHDT
jgi:hypothetical protein